MPWRRKMSATFRTGSNSACASDSTGGSGDAVTAQDVLDVAEVVVIVGVLAPARLGRHPSGCGGTGLGPGGRPGGQLFPRRWERPGGAGRGRHGGTVAVLLDPAPAQRAGRHE